MRHCISTIFLSLALRLGALALLPLPAHASGAPPVPAMHHPSPPTSHMAAACTALASKVSQLIPGYPVSNVVNEILPANSTFDQGTFDYAQPVVSLPELCRFGAYFNTSSKSAVKFEVWMPTHGWNGRFAFNGNGGTAGGVNYPSMGGAVSNYGFAAASTNTGHESSDLVGTFAANNPQSQIDFGYRAVHLSTIFSKNVVRAFYGSKAKKFRSYWLGCSSGGKQGLKEAQMYPDDYDGILAGSPAWWWDHLMAWGLYGGLLNPEGPGHLNTTDFSALHEAIIAQCDALDGLTDGIVTNPALCKVDWAKTGLSAAQQKQVAVYYEDWISSSGELLFPGYSPGAEELGLTSAGGSIIEFAPDYYRYQVLNYTNITAAANVNFTDVHQLEKLVSVADKTNPGGLVADHYDISPFFHRGGKLLHYGGTQDQLIDWGSSVLYHNRTLQTLGDVSSAYRLFGVPGMGHCGGGSRAPNVFGGDTGASGSKPSNMKPSNNAILALIEWVERGVAPDQIVGSGTNFTRPLCPYPKFAKYVRGDVNEASSFICK